MVKFQRFLTVRLTSDANESSYSTGLQEDWDPTHPKFNVDALLDPDAFVEGGKVLHVQSYSVLLSM